MKPLANKYEVTDTGRKYILGVIPSTCEITDMKEV